MPVSLDIKPNLEYLVTPAAILKICQFVLLMLAFSLITDCCDGGKNTQFYGTALKHEYSITNSRVSLVERDYLPYPKNVSFFLAVTVLGWILVGFFFFLFFLGFHEKINQVDNLVMITSIAWSVLLLLCCSLMAETFKTSNLLKPLVYHDTTTRVKVQKWLDTMIAGVVFGFLSMIAFIVDAVLLVREICGDGQRNAVESSSSNPEQTQSQMSPGQTLQTAPGQTLQTAPGQTLHAYPGQANPVYQGQPPPVFSYPKQG